MSRISSKIHEIILIKTGELALKGLNRPIFEKTLIKKLKSALKPAGDCVIRSAQSTIMIEPADYISFDFDLALSKVACVFGIAAFSRAAVCDKDYAAIEAISADYLYDELTAASTFKVNAKRSDKTFSMKSPEICRDLGGYLLSKFPHLSVDVNNPDVTVTVEIRDFDAYIRCGQLHGAGGLPTGTAGRAVTLMSGGIDSPVASYMMAKRGLELVAVHFASPPYTGKRAEDKVKTLLSKVARYAGDIHLYVVPFTEIQLAIREHCPEEYLTVIMRRLMMRIAERIALKQDCGALITGESLAQVASQTMSAIHCTGAVCTLPVLRPLVGMDKDEIIAVSRRIDTFETSILPFEDCCTVFTPAHPRTKPKLQFVEEAESAVDFDPMIEKALEGLRPERISG